MSATKTTKLDYYETSALVGCLFCDDVFPQRTQLENHLKFFHPGWSSAVRLTVATASTSRVKWAGVKCSWCGTNFGEESSLHQHEIAVHVQPLHYRCPFCSKNYLNCTPNSREIALKNHLKSLHADRLRKVEKVEVATPERTVHRCLFCTASFDTPKAKANHEFVSHLNEWKMVCPKCGKDFKSFFPKFHDHMRGHFGVFSCYICDKDKSVPQKNFLSLKNKNEHINSVHPGHPIPCEEPCMFQADNLEVYHDHMISKHANANIGNERNLDCRVRLKRLVF